MSEPLVVAVPSKGRLQANAAAFFARAGFALVQPGGARDYRGGFAGVEGVEVLFLAAAEITAHLAQGAVHLGVTGEDLARETVADADRRLAFLAPLGFGHASVVVAVPRAWIDVRGMADLDDVAAALRARTGERMRVATKYVNLTRRFFGRHGLADYRIAESTGATEGAPASGTADIIVDITTTGATLAANALKPLEDGLILRSEAQLTASLAAGWGGAARERARSLLRRISAEEAARTSREVVAVSPGGLGENLAAALAQHGARALDGAAGAAGRRFLCPTYTLHAFCEWLISNGADDVTVAPLEFLYRSANPLWDELAARLPG